MVNEMSHAVLIVNPFASRVTEARLRAVEQELASTGHVRTVLTEHPLHASELAREATEVDAVFVFGGDGVANEVLNGLERDIPVGFLPGGGTSVLARALGLPRDPVAAARCVRDALEHDRTRRISLGRVNGRRFAFSAGIGFAADLVRRVDGLGRRADGRRPGDLAYLREAAGLLARRRGRFEP